MMMMIHSKKSSRLLLLSQLLLLFTVIEFVYDLPTKSCFIVGWVVVVDVSRRYPPRTRRSHCRCDRSNIGLWWSSWNPKLRPSSSSSYFHQQHPSSNKIQRTTRQRWAHEETIYDESSNTIVVPEHNHTTTPTTNILDTLLLWFQGDFDNYRQVVLDRQAGLLPREYGGHEHIHCSLIPVTVTSRLAAFYFDGVPDAIFRFRFYQLQTSSTDGSTVDTILYTLSKELETKLRACTDVMRWPNIFVQYVREQMDDATTRVTGTDDDDIVEWAIQSSLVTILPKCEVRWSRERDTIQHSYVNDMDQGNNNNNVMDPHQINSGLHAIMVHGEALVDSQMIPGQKILIQDQLSLWDDQLWIHDRGYHPDTGAYIYGNQFGIPYRMQRVTDMVSKGAEADAEDDDVWTCPDISATTVSPIPPPRRITDTALAWTLGNNYRTPAEYETNMRIIGGSSRQKK